jgi:sugar transferase (PEP-CTERM/EpsH1 system associated)
MPLKILVLCRELPLPLTSGEKIRCYHILKELAQRHEVSLVSLVLKEPELGYVEELSKLCQHVYTFRFNLSKKRSALSSVFSVLPWDVVAFNDRLVKSKISELLKTQKYDVIWVNFLAMSGYIDSSLLGDTKLILDQHNVDNLVWAGYARNSHNLAMKIFALLNLQKVKLYQNKIFKYFDTVVSVSEADAKYMREHNNSTIDIKCIPNGVDTDYFLPALVENKGNIIVLCASMDVDMNIDAALNFSRIFPLIKKKVIDSEFWIVGRNPPKQILNLQKQGYIKVTGSVADVRPYYEKAKVVIAPYRFGGGTKLKILEALAMNLPIVSTKIGCQGINTTGIGEIKIHDNMVDFAGAVIEVLETNEAKTTERNNGARKIVEERYGWSTILQALSTGLLRK